MFMSFFKRGFNYAFDTGPARINNDAERSIMRLYQSYPFTAVNGSGQMVQNSGYFNPMHPMPLRAVANTVDASVKGAGQLASTVYLAPLINTTSGDDYSF